MDELHLEVPPGVVFGFLGPNGAGKTTTIRMLLDLIRPTRGEAEVLGLDVRRDGVEIRARCGYLPGELHLPEGPTARAFLAHLSRLRGSEPDGAGDELAERLGLSLDRPLGDLSKGNRQKAGLVAAFMHDPDLLILDEPTSGLDPIRQETVLEMIRERAAAGRTVFLSSHALDQVERVADRVGIIRRAVLVAVEDTSDLRRRALREVEVRFEGPAPAELGGVRGVSELRIEGDTARLRVEGNMDDLVKALAAHPVRSMTAEPPELEQVFLSYYGRGDES